MKRSCTSFVSNSATKVLSALLLCGLLTGVPFSSRAQAPIVINYTSPHTLYISEAAKPIVPETRNVNPIGHRFAAVVTKLGTGSDMPRGVATDSLGNVYVSDMATDRVLMYPAGGGAPIVKASGIRKPGSIAYRRGDLYVISGSNSIMKIAAGTNAVTTFQGFGSRRAKGIAAGLYDYVYVCLTDNARGNSVVRFPSFIGIPGFQDPEAVATDSYGNVYVADYGSNVIKKVDPFGTIIKVIASITQPTSLCIDAANDIYVGTKTGSMYKLAANTYAVSLVLAGTSPIIYDLAVNRQGVLYTVSLGKQFVAVHHPIGGFYINNTLPLGLNFDENTGTISGTPTVLWAPHDYTVIGYNQTNNTTSSLNIAVTGAPISVNYYNPQRFSVGKPIDPLTPKSKHVNAYGFRTLADTLIGGFDNAIGIKTDSLGNVYVADASQGRIRMFPAGGGSPVTKATLYVPLAIALDAAGNIYATTYDSTLKKIAAGTNTVSTLLTGIPDPEAVAVDKNGFIYVCSHNRGTILKIPPAGGKSTKIVNGLNQPDDIAVDDDGNVFFTENGTNSVKEVLASNGSVQTVVSIFKPFGITFDAAHNMYVSSSYYTAFYKIAANTNAIDSMSFHERLGKMAINPQGVIYGIPDGQHIMKTKPIGGYFLNTSLPPGLNFDITTGIISGTPTRVTDAKDYKITAYNTINSVTVTQNIAVVLSVQANLVSLTMDPASIIKPDSNSTTTYYRSATVDPATTSITLKPTANIPDAVITIGSQTVASGTVSSPIALNATGPTVVNVVVTAADNSSTKTYQITINKNGSSNAILTDLRIKGEPALTQVKNSPLVDSCSLTMQHRGSSVTVIATASDPAATITINTVPTASGAESAPISITEGVNTITVAVTAPDGVTVKNYIITVTKDNSILADIVTQQSDAIADNITVHTAVTPNGNGVNDFLKIDGIEAYPDNKLQVINTGGTKVFEATGYNNQTKVFDGHSSVNGSKQNAGTYFYVLQYKVKGVSKTKSGYLVLKY